MSTLIRDPAPRAIKPRGFDRNLPVLGRRSKAELAEIAFRAFVEVESARRLVGDPARLRAFIWAASRHYHDNPYHNFQHAVDTTNVMAWLLSLPRIRALLPPPHPFVLLLAALVHDMDHPGTDNQWEIKTQTPRARLYHNISVLEHHSLDLARTLLNRPEYDLFADLPPAMREEAHDLLAVAILATDFSKHGAFLQELGTALDGSGRSAAGQEFHSLLSRALIKAADISNTAKEFHQARLWGRRVMRENWAQGELEKGRGLPVGPLNDRNKVEFHAAQGWFIENQVMPLFRWLARIDEGVQEAVESLATNHGIYQRMVARRRASLTGN